MPDNVMEFETPNFAIVGQPGPDGKVFLGLMVSLKQMQFTIYLCKAEDFRKVADGIADGIRKAGQDAVRANLGLVVANGAMPDGPEGWKQRGPSSPR